MHRVLTLVPHWVIMLAGILLVAVIGVIDHLTGDYSILIFYLIPIGIVSWYTSRFWGVATALASGLARFCSDYSWYTKTTPRMYWNCTEETLFLLVLALLISIIKRQLQGSSPIEK